MGKFKYGERGAGPNQVTTAGDQTFAYDAAGQMKQYNGFDLFFDVEGRLVRAEKPNDTSVEYYYNDIGEKKLAIIRNNKENVKINRYISEDYQIRNNQEIWFVSGGHGRVEITDAKGLEIDLDLLEEMTAYVADPAHSKKPVPAEYMDLDGDGDYDFDSEDLRVAKNAYWNGIAVGKDAQVWRYYHEDHLGSSAIVTDSMGDVVSTTKYHPYGQIALKQGVEPIYGFSGAENEEESELGLLQFGARWYAPGVGRWVSPDPTFVSSAGKNVEYVLESGLYSYASNCPIFNNDPEGSHPAKAVLKAAARWIAKRGTKYISKHIAKHARQISGKAVHSIFKQPRKINQLVKKTIDEAKTLAEKATQHAVDDVIEEGGLRISSQINKNGKVRTVVEKVFANDIGTKGEKVLRVVLDVTGRVVTAFPSDALKKLGIGAAAMAVLDEKTAEASEKIRNIASEQEKKANSTKETISSFVYDLLIPIWGGNLNEGEEYDIAVQRAINSAVNDIITEMEKSGTTLSSQQRNELDDIVRAGVGVGLLSDENEKSGNE